MDYSKRFFNQQKAIVLLLVSLAMSIGLNVYLYLNQNIPQDSQHIPETCTIVTGINGMGNLRVTLSAGFAIRPRGKFNITVSASLWEPYVGSAICEFYFKVYERPLHGEYSAPILEKKVTVHKDKNEIWIKLHSGNLTVTGPATSGIYIYKVCFGTLPAYLLTSLKHTVEIPFWTYPPYYPTG